MWDLHAFGHYDLFCRELRDILDYAGPHKVLFGTDNPIFNTIEPTRNWIQLLKDLPTHAPRGIRFTEGEVAASSAATRPRSCELVEKRAGGAGRRIGAGQQASMNMNLGSSKLLLNTDH